MNRYTFIILLIVLIYSLPVVCQNKIGLNKAIELAVAHNLQVRASKINELVSVQDIGKSKLGLLPNLNASIASQLDFGRSLDPVTYTYVTNKTIYGNGTISSNVVLFQGFQKLNQIKQNKLLLETNQSATKKLINDLILNVIATYFGILNYTDQLSAAKQQKVVADQQLNFVIKNYDVGKKMAADISNAKYQVTKTEYDIANIENQLSAANLDLIQYLDADPNVNFELEPPSDNIVQSEITSLAEIYKTALRNMPEIRYAELVTKTAEQQISIAKGGYYPTLNLSGVIATNYSYQYNTPNALFYFPPPPLLTQLHENLYEYLGLSLNIPLFNGLTNKIAVNKAKLNLQSTIVSQEIAKTTLYKIISQAISDLNTSEKNYALSQQSFEFAKETFNVTQKRYINGLANALNLNQAQSDMNQAEFVLIRNKYDLIFKRKTIDFYLGKSFSY